MRPKSTSSLCSCRLVARSRSAIARRISSHSNSTRPAAPCRSHCNADNGADGEAAVGRRRDHDRQRGGAVAGRGGQRRAGIGRHGADRGRALHRGIDDHLHRRRLRWRCRVGEHHGTGGAPSGGGKDQLLAHNVCRSVGTVQLQPRGGAQCQRPVDLQRRAAEHKQRACHLHVASHARHPHHRGGLRHRNVAWIVIQKGGSRRGRRGRRRCCRATSDSRRHTANTNRGGSSSGSSRGSSRRGRCSTLLLSLSQHR